MKALWGYVERHFGNACTEKMGLMVTFLSEMSMNTRIPNARRERLQTVPRPE